MADVMTALMVCQDCLAWVANGAFPPDNTRAQDDDFVRRVALNLGDDARWLCCGDSERDEAFSWSACECCGSALGGSRHQLAVVR